MSAPASPSKHEAPTRPLSGVDTEAEGPTPPPMDDTVGRYLMIEELGRGGMGEVMRAYDPRLGREVAIKRVRGSSRGAESTARLLREARAMAQLTHPNVVAVYDAEEIDDGVAIAMELVRGRTLTRWLAEAPRSLEEISSVFRQIGAGLSAAHRAGLVHRDVKPANIFVGLDGRVRVGDFGIAKAMQGAISIRDPAPDAEGSEESGGSPGVGAALTRADEVVGTPGYMAPEQHLGRAATAAADQYSTAVMLWRALCGRSPFPGRDSRALCRAKLHGPPPWPDGIAVPSHVVTAISRALAPQPEDRWPSMDAFVRALGAGNRNRRLRRLGLVGLGATMVAAFVATTRDAPAARCGGAEDELAAVWNDARRDEIATAFSATSLPYADASRERVVRALDAYATAWVDGHRDACEATVVRGEATAEMMEQRLGCLRRARTDMRARVDALAAADAAVVERSARLVGGLPDTHACSDPDALRREDPTPVDPTMAEEIDAVRTQIARTRAGVDAGRYATALEIADDAVRTADALGAERVVADALSARGGVEDALGRFADAEASWKRAFELYLAQHRHQQAALTAGDLAYLVGGKQARHAEAFRRIEIGLALASRSPDAEIEVKLLSNRGTLRFVARQLAEAETDLRRALEIAERHGHSTRSLRSNLATVLHGQRRREEAIEMMREVVDAEIERNGPDHPEVALARNNLGAMLAAAGRFEEGAVQMRAAVAVRERLLHPDSPELAGTIGNLGLMLSAAGRPEAAIVEHRRALPRFRRSVGPQHPDTILCMDHLAGAMVEAGRTSEAEVVLREALSDARALGATHHIRLEVERDLGLVLLDREQYAEARPLFEHLLVGLETQESTDPPTYAQAPWWLAQTLGDTPAERSRARALARTSIERLAHLGEQAQELVREIEQWLVDHPAIGARR